MITARSIAAIAGCLIACQAAGSAGQPRPRPAPAAKQPSAAAVARLQEHQRRTREGEQASRAQAPAAPPVAPGPGGLISFPNGILQFLVTPEPWIKQNGAISGAVPRCPYIVGQTPQMRTASLVKAFPEVIWHICVTDMGMKGLWVGPVQRARFISGPWTTVLHQAGPAEIFVPYHDGINRFHDLRFTLNLDQVGAQDAGLSGALVYLTNETIPTVVAEVRERGVAWLCKGNISSGTRRGQELVIWGVSDAGNYDNIIEYTFRDDGGIVFRTGNTGYNSVAQPVEPHTHDTLWRVDVDLNGADNDTPWWLEHNEPVSPTQPLRANDRELLVRTESARQWGGRINSLLVTDAAVNAFRHRLGYEFSPLQEGAARHFGPLEAWTRNDIFVTRYHPTELNWTLPDNWTEPDNYLLAYLNNESTFSQDLVVWVNTTAHHHPTDEDRAARDLGTRGTTGITLTHWSGFRMEPHHSFNANPLGGPSRCGT